MNAVSFKYKTKQCEDFKAKCESFHFYPLDYEHVLRILVPLTATYDTHQTTHGRKNNCRDNVGPQKDFASSFLALGIMPRVKIQMPSPELCVGHFTVETL